MSAAAWAGDAPERYRTVRLGSVVRQVRRRNVGMMSDNLLSLSYGEIVRKDISGSDGLLPESFETYNVISCGDIVLRLTDLQNDKRSLRSGLVREDGIITSAYTTVRPVAVDSRFIAYQLRAIDLAKTFYSLGGGLRQSLGFDDVKTLSIVLPPASEQRQIADYLDHETAEIDAFIADLDRLGELSVEEKEQFRTTLLLDGAAIQGLAPLKYLARVTVGIVVEPSRYYTDEGTPALRGLNVSPEKISTRDLVRLTPQGHKHNRKSELATGDVVMVRTGQAGAAAVVPEECDGWNAIDLLIVKPRSRLNGAFLAALINSHEMQSQIRGGSVGAIQAHFNVESLSNLRIPTFSFSEQRARAAAWLERSAAVDVAMRDIDAAIALAKERRAALITAAVTGQIDVTTRQRPAVDSIQSALQEAR